QGSVVGTDPTSAPRRGSRHHRGRPARRPVGGGRGEIRTAESSQIRHVEGNGPVDGVFRRPAGGLRGAYAVRPLLSSSALIAHVYSSERSRGAWCSMEGRGWRDEKLVLTGRSVALRHHGFVAPSSQF